MSRLSSSSSPVESIATTAQISPDHTRLARVESKGGDALPPEQIVSQNPHTDPVHGRHGHMAAHRATLTDEELRKYCRCSNWSREQEIDPPGRRCSSKTLSAAQRDLVERGLDPQSWRNGTESE